MDKTILDIELQDDATSTGGVAFQGETLRDFLDEAELAYDTPIEEVNKALKECGIKPIQIQKKSLHAFLREFDFDYKKDAEGYYLIDLQCANLGGIEQEVFKDIPGVVDRMNTYYEDYLVSSICDSSLNSDHIKELNLDLDSCETYRELYNELNKVDDPITNYYRDMFFYILNPEYLSDEEE